MVLPRVARILRPAGHDVYTPTLTGLGEHTRRLTPGIDLDTHIDDITALLFYEDLRDVILVGHSYGGMVITGAADRAAERIGKLVYLDAATPANGQSLVDVAGPMMLAARAQGRVIDGIELVLFPERGRGPLLRSDRSRRPRLDGRSAHAAPVEVLRTTVETYERSGTARHPAVPHRVHADAGNTRPGVDGQARAAGRLWDIDTGHDLMITEPAAVAAALLGKIAHEPA